MDSQEDKVRDALATFLRKHSAEASINSIDDIVLSYLASILEEIGEEGNVDSFDFAEFIEIMEAYLPGFAEIQSDDVCEWISGLASKLGGPEQKPTETPVLSLRPKSPVLVINSPSMHGQKRTHSTSERETPHKEQNGRSPKVSESESYEDDEQVQRLLEMFPSSCEIEVTHCLCVAGGDAERAAQLILHRQESGENFQSSAMQGKKNALQRNSAVLDDKTMKKNILERYSYVDTDEDKKEHRPVMPKMEPKKLVRYLDNKVVTTKGERFTEIKKDDPEEVKKTTVNLKPAKQYRFH